MSYEFATTPEPSKLSPEPSKKGSKTPEPALSDVAPKAPAKPTLAEAAAELAKLEPRVPVAPTKPAAPIKPDPVEKGTGSDRPDAGPIAAPNLGHGEATEDADASTADRNPKPGIRAESDEQEAPEAVVSGQEAGSSPEAGVNATETSDVPQAGDPDADPATADREAEPKAETRAEPKAKSKAEGRAEPEATAPEATEPGATEPGATAPEATADSAAASTATAPEAPQPEQAFPGVPGALCAALVRRGFTELTSVQTAAVQNSGEACDLRISSQTGSGKTVAFGLAIAPALLEQVETGPGPSAMVIVPTRELAAQVKDELSWLFADVRGVSVDAVTGGTHVGQERRRLTRRPKVLVGTPGRLLDHIRSGALDCSKVAQLVLDEADQMLDLGFRDELEAIIEALPVEGRRTHMLSATFPSAVKRLADRMQSNPRHVEGTQLGQANEDIAHVAHLVRSHERFGAVVNLLLLAGDERTLIFVATRADASTLAEKLSKEGFGALPLSGELAQAQRTRTLNSFRSGAVNVLVATDVAARGLDVPEVGTVIHGDLPMDGEVYTHRSGRTGRAGRKGRSVLLVSPNGQRRVRRILGDAGLDPQWLPLPTAEVVERSLRKRARRAIHQKIQDAANEVSESDLEFAKSLLAEQEPEQLVGILLAHLRTDRVRDPFDFESPAVPGAFRAEERRQSGPSQKPPLMGRAGEFAKFKISWGFRNGATAKRLLAALCRRGGVSSRMIGAIDIEAFTSTFDVAKDVAQEFEQRAKQRDERDPDQRIERVYGGGAASSGRGRGPKPRSRPSRG